MIRPRGGLGRSISTFTVTVVASAVVTSPQPSASDPRDIPTPAGFGQLNLPVQEQFHTLVHRLSKASGPDVGRELGHLGVWHWAYRYTDAAAGYLEKATALQPHELRWRYYLGHVELERGRPGAARYSFEKALLIAPDDVPTLVHLAELEMQEGRLDAAEVLLNRARKARPWGIRTTSRLGQLALARGRFDEAIQLLAEALERAPDDRQTRYLLATALRRSGRQEEAGRQLARFVAGDTSPPRRLFTIRSSTRSTRSASMRWRSPPRRAARSSRDALRTPRRATAALSRSLASTPR